MIQCPYCESDEVRVKAYTMSDTGTRVELDAHDRPWLNATDFEFPLPTDGYDYLAPEASLDTRDEIAECVRCHHAANLLAFGYDPDWPEFAINLSLTLKVRVRSKTRLRRATHSLLRVMRGDAVREALNSLCVTLLDEMRAYSPAIDLEHADLRIADRQ